MIERVDSDEIVIHNRGVFRRLFENFFSHSSHGGLLPPNISEVKVAGVDCKLYRSGRVSKGHAEGLHKLGVQKVISFYNDGNSNDAQELRSELSRKGIQNEIIVCPCQKMNIELVRNVIYSLLAEEKVQLLNCHAGADRTGLVIAALRRMQGESTLSITADLLRHTHVPWKKFWYFYREILPEFQPQKSSKMPA